MSCSAEMSMKKVITYGPDLDLEKGSGLSGIVLKGIIPIL